MRTSSLFGCGPATLGGKVLQHGLLKLSEEGDPCGEPRTAVGNHVRPRKQVAQSVDNIRIAELFEVSAYHEAGHAFMAVYVGARVRSVTIEPDWDDGPERHADIQVQWPTNPLTNRELCEKSILVALAGPVAEMLHSGEPYHPGFVAEWAADWNTAWEAAAQLFASEPRRLAYLEQVTVKLHRFLDREEHWAALAAIVDNLLAHETLEGEEVESIVQQWL